jgi:hypothetical protein
MATRLLGGFKVHAPPKRTPAPTAASPSNDDNDSSASSAQRHGGGPPSLNRVPSGLPPPPTRQGRNAPNINPNNIQVVTHHTIPYHHVISDGRARQLSQLIRWYLMCCGM